MYFCTRSISHQNYKNMLKATPANLKKLEILFKDLGYKIIYEKGHFQSGYCIVNAQNMIVVNKFYKTDVRINCLVQILNEIKVENRELNADNLAFYDSLTTKE